MKHTLKITGLLVLLFLTAQLIGLYVVNQYFSSDLPYEIERPELEENTSFLPITLIILLGTGLALLLVKFKALKLWKIWFFVGILFTLLISFGAFVDEKLALIFAILFALIKVFKSNVILHNFSELFIYSGIAAIFVPLFSIWSIVILLLIISVYDMIAVWKTKHMISLAKYQAKAKVFAGLFIPYGKNKSAVLGGGDIGFPLIFAGVVLNKLGFVPSLIVVLGSTIALFLLFMYSKKNKFYPAMPFITAGSLIGYGISFFI